MNVREFIATLRADSTLSDDLKKLRLAFIYQYLSPLRESSGKTRKEWMDIYNAYLDGWIGACRLNKIPFYFTGKPKGGK